MNATTDVCPNRAVCWNWVLYGGTADTADPRLLVDVPLRTSNIARLRTLLAVAGTNLHEAEESPLFLVGYLDRDGFIRHVEFRFAIGHNDFITITKGDEVDLLAFHGVQRLEGPLANTVVARIPIEVWSLTTDHVAAIRGLVP